MKYIVIVPDGAADYPIEELGNKTPLEAAHTANMDYLAQNGYVGLVQTIPDKMKPGSDVGNLSVLGYDPTKYFSGRAPLEAANLNVELAENEIAFRCNLITATDNKMKDYSAGHISTQEASKLIDTLNEESGETAARFVTGKSYRHLCILKVRNPEEFIKIKCIPPHDILDKNMEEYLPKGVGSRLLLKLMERSKTILGNHPVNDVRIDLKENPANMIWLWGQGMKSELPPFKEKYGVDGAIISAVDLVNGIGKIAGLEVITVPGITGYYDTNYLGKAQYAIESLKTKDFVFIHIEGPDEAGHNGNFQAKISCIEHIDREIVGTILNHFDQTDDARILVLPDHSTPVSLRTHTSDLIPFVMYGKRIPSDDSLEYSEVAARKNGLKFKNCEQLMKEFITRYI